MGVSVDKLLDEKVLIYFPEEVRRHAKYYILVGICRVEKGDSQILLNGIQLGKIHDFLGGLSIGLTAGGLVEPDTLDVVCKAWYDVVTNDLPDIEQGCH